MTALRDQAGGCEGGREGEEDGQREEVMERHVSWHG